MAIRVVLVEQNEITRIGQREVLAAAKGLEVVGETGHDSDVLALLADVDPQVVIVGSAPPELDGVEITQQITSTASTRGAAVIVISEHDDGEELVRAIQAGASAVLSRNCRMGELIEAVQVVAESSAFLTPSMLRRLFSLFREHGTLGTRVADGLGTMVLGNLPNLTRREREVARMVALGSSNAQIARRLKLSVKTVEGHLSRTYAKLGTASRAALASAITRAGLFEEK